MNIGTTTRHNFSPLQQRMQAPNAAPAEFTPAAAGDLVTISNGLDSQQRGDYDQVGKLLGGMFYGGIGAAGGAAGGAVISAVAGASGWGVALSTVGGLVAGGLTGAYLGSR